MPPAKAALVKNGKPAAKATVESSSEEEVSDDESEEEVKVALNALFYSCKRLHVGVLVSISGYMFLSGCP